MTQRRFFLLAGALMILIFAAGNLLAQRWFSGARIDLTENKLYTLSEGTSQLLGALDEPVDLTFVYTRDVGQAYPGIRAYAVRVRELLAAYKSKAGANLNLREIDPAPFSEAEDEALAAGLVALETNGGDPLYFGLIGRNGVDDERVIAFLAPERETRLEYDLTRMIARLDEPEPTRIGLLSTLPGMAAITAEAGYALRGQIEETFSLDLIEEDFVELPEDMDLLMLAHPPQLTEWQLWQIDQFVLRKGRALILLDPAAKTAQGTGPFNMSNRQTRSDLDHFAPAWGLRLDRSAIADTETALSIQADAGEGRTTVLSHPLFLAIPPERMSRTSLITADLVRTVNLGAPGQILLNDGAPGEREVLMTTGPVPSKIDPEQAAIDMSASDTIGAYEPVDTGAAPLAVRLTGPLISAFPEGRPEPDLPEDPFRAEQVRAALAEADPHISTSEVDAEIIMIADADMLDDGLYFDLQTSVPFADNAAFVLNALDSLSGGSELMGLRARAPGRRSMTTVDKMREAAQLEFFDEQSRLEARLNDTEARLQALQTASSGEDGFGAPMNGALSEGEQAELARLREDIVTTRARLRQIERDYRKDINALEWRLRAFTLLTGPALLALLGSLLWSRRRNGGLS